MHRDWYHQSIVDGQFAIKPDSPLATVDSQTFAYFFLASGSLSCTRSLSPSG